MRRLTDNGIAKLKSKPSRYSISDPGQPGLVLRVMPSGAKTFAVAARGPAGPVVWHTIGDAKLIGIDKAREKARMALRKIKAGESTAEPESFSAVADEWIKRHVDARGLRSKKGIERHLVHMRAAWRDLKFESIRRGDITKLLDQVEDRSSVRQRDDALAVLRSLCNWYAARHEDYLSPIVKGMRRYMPKEHQRTRILTDDEIRAVWKVADANGTFGAFVRLLLLTAQRRDKVASMRWQDIKDGAWEIPSEKREKGNAGLLVLPPKVLEIIEAQPELVSNPYVFAGRGGSHFRGYSKAKKAFDLKTGIKEQWGLHDLRRTARSLMSRAGVRPDIAERVLGHAIAGVEGVYDRHSYEAEKAHALAALAGLIATILNPAPNVVAMTRQA